MDTRRKCSEGALFDKFQNCAEQQSEVMASERKVVVEWPFGENGAEKIYTALVKENFLSFEMCFKVGCRSNGVMRSRHMIEQTPYDVKIKQKTQPQIS